jgi:hypothetical protein
MMSDGVTDQYYKTGQEKNKRYDPRRKNVEQGPVPSVLRFFFKQSVKGKPKGGGGSGGAHRCQLRPVKRQF